MKPQKYILASGNRGLNSSIWLGWKMFRNLLIVSCSIFAMTVGAQAADLPIRKSPPPAPPVVAPAFTWTGVYAGIHAGWGIAAPKENSGDVSALFIRGYSKSVDTPNGVLAGPYVGANYQFSNNVVIGLEADYSFSAVKGKASGIGNDVFGPTAYSVSARLHNLGTVRGRLGYAVDRWLPYVTAGFAWGRAKSTFQLPGFASTNANDHTGWVAGAGVEYAATNNVILRAEAMYVDLGEKRYGQFVPVRVQARGGLARVGVSYKF